MNYIAEQVAYTEIELPVYRDAKLPVLITKDTIEARKKKVLKKIQDYGIDALFVYADREHGFNFSYLTGFEPRFEEAALVLHKEGKGYLLLGNEMLPMNHHCRISTEAIHVPHFSLPNQPMDGERELSQILAAAGILPGMQIGVVGWKLFTSALTDNEQVYDVPHFLVEALQKTVGCAGRLRSLGKLFLDPQDGVRITANANEIAHYEFGAAVASDCVMECMEQAAVGKTEMEMASVLAAFGQPVSVQTICATGERFTDAVVAPRNKTSALGDRFSVTMGLRGGLTSRAAYMASSSAELPPAEQDYLEKMAKPYFAALATWYSTVGLDITAGELYHAVDNVLPKQQYGWTLNPGHLTSNEEWLSSPIYRDSPIKLKSGMMLQMDIIPQIKGYGRAGAEDGIALADKELRMELQMKYPQVWKRMCRRRAYMENVLGIRLKEEVLPLSDIAGYYRPFLLNKNYSFKMEGKQNEYC